MPASPPEEKKLFKDWFDRDAAKQIAAQIAASYPAFDNKKFVSHATRNLKKLEMSDRVKQFSASLRRCLPEDYCEAIAAIVGSLPPPMENCEFVTNGYLQWPVGQFIADYGTDHFKESMDAMAELTKRFSSEFAIRPFVEMYPEKTFKHLLKLTKSKNPHIRRWCSEGIRPRLPWGRLLRDLIDDPSPIIPILQALKDDNELYVRRSVANNLNDIAKDHPDQVIEICQSWRNGDENRDWIIKHALRSLIKAGNPDALALIGYGPPKKLKAELSISPQKIKVGESVELSASLESSFGKKQQFVVDYAVHYIRQGNKTSDKVFKWKNLTLPAKGSIELQKKHSMKVTTVRALYPGVHHVELQVNGKRVAKAEFELVD